MDVVLTTARVGQRERFRPRLIFIRNSPVPINGTNRRSQNCLRPLHAVGFEDISRKGHIEPIVAVMLGDCVLNRFSAVHIRQMRRPVCVGLVVGNRLQRALHIHGCFGLWGFAL